MKRVKASLITLIFLQTVAATSYQERYSNDYIDEDDFSQNFVGKYKWKYTGFEPVKIDLGQNGNWPFAYWPDINPWGGKFNKKIIEWFENGGQTDVKTKDLHKLVIDILEINDPESIEWIMTAAQQFLNIDIHNTGTIRYTGCPVKLKRTLDHIPWGQHFKALKILFSDILESLNEDITVSIQALLKILVKKLTILDEGEIFQDAMESNGKQLSINKIGDELHSLLQKQFTNWHHHSTQWMLNIILRYYFVPIRTNEVMDLEDLPNDILKIYPDAKADKSVYIYFLKVLKTVLHNVLPGSASSQFLVILKHVKNNMEMYVFNSIMKITIVKWIYYNQKFYAVGLDNKPILDFDPIAFGDTSPYVSGWLITNGQPIPLNKNRKPWPTEIYSETIAKWIVFEGYYLPVNLNGNSLENIEPIKIGDTNNIVIRWIKVNGEDTPLGLDEKIIPIEHFPFKIVKWVILGGKYVPINADGKPIPGLQAVKPGERNIFIIKWENIAGVQVPIGINGKPIIIESPTTTTASTFRIVKWYVINHKYVPIGPDGNPIIEISPLSALADHTLIKKWLIKNGIPTPVLKDDEILPVILIVKWVFEDNKLVPKGLDDKTVNEINPISPGEANPYLIWKFVKGELIPFDQTGNEIPTERKTTPSPIKETMIIKWIVINGKYIPIGKDNKIIPGVEPITPGESNVYVKDWINNDGTLVPQESNGHVAPVIIIIEWVYENGKLVPARNNHETIEEIEPLIPGQGNHFVIWKFVNGKFTPVYHDGKPVPIGIKRHPQNKTPNIIKWILFDGKYLPLDENDEPLSNINPIAPGEINSLIKEWVMEDEIPVPIKTNGEINKVIIVVKWQFEDGKLVPLDANDELIKEIKPINPGEKNPYVIWTIINGELKPVDQNGDTINTEISTSITKQTIVIRWIVINGKYIPIDENNKPISDATIKLCEKSQLVKDWTNQNGLPVPIEKSGKITSKIIIVKWVYENGKLVAKDHNNDLVPGIEPVSPGENSPYVIWITIGDEKIPVDQNHEPLLPQTSVTKPPSKLVYVLKIIVINGKYFLTGLDGNLIPGSKPLSPGDDNPYIKWHFINGKYIPFRSNGEQIEVDEPINITKWVVINNRYVPVGPDEKPVKGLSPISPYDTNQIVINWITLNGNKVPVGLDGNIMPVEFSPYTISKWIILNGKYVPIDSNFNAIPEINPISPGELTPYVLRWHEFQETAIPVGPDNKAVVLLLPPFIISKWFIIDGKYVPYGPNGKPVPRGKPLSPGEKSSFVISWKVINGNQVPIGPGNTILPVEREPSIDINWTLNKEEYVPFHTNGNPISLNFPIYGLSSEPNDADLQNLMYNLFSRNTKIYYWLTPLLMALRKIDPKHQTLPNENIINAPFEILHKFPLPSKLDENNLLQWLQKVILKLSTPLKGVELTILKYFQISLNTLTQMMKRVNRSRTTTTHYIIIINGQEIQTDENGKPIGDLSYLSQETIEQFNYNTVSKILQGEIKIDGNDVSKIFPNFSSDFEIDSSILNSPGLVHASNHQVIVDGSMDLSKLPPEIQQLLIQKDSKFIPQLRLK